MKPELPCGSEHTRVSLSLRLFPSVAIASYKGHHGARCVERLEPGGLTPPGSAPLQVRRSHAEAGRQPSEQYRSIRVQRSSRA
jgi:hypothetical protein